ncbi:MAG: crossover junction endodeoxyribonuclease RuvC [Sutterellaceae bacterium]|nr:crossover junction endodeoxyribonuclease RuvC [Burkholderiaceae bacterium]MCX7900750.1 crossover junction endodeoxyribonuclease RuvC [Burkholderiaceae bacterium]MDW8429865.1 crossover junction endodeoxyribonuclease RuvC [Sutterellaceae bacterium]
MSHVLRILGIDPGLNRTGYGVIAVEGSRMSLVQAGVIRVPPGALAQRLRAILLGLTEVIVATSPQRVAIEKVFVNINAQATLLLGQARGAAICAAVAASLPVNEHSALRIKQAVVGYGGADKQQVQSMVQRLLALPQPPVQDAADALACAICDAHGTDGRAAASTRARRGAAAWRALGERLLRA